MLFISFYLVEYSFRNNENTIVSFGTLFCIIYSLNNPSSLNPNFLSKLDDAIFSGNTTAPILFKSNCSNPNFITSFIAQGYEPLVATYIAAFIHGYCGDRLSENMFCVNATHIVEELPFIINEIMNEN